MNASDMNRGTNLFDAAIKAKAKNELRGINFVDSSGLCTCIPKANVRYNVTAVQSFATAGCRSYVTHDCPDNFDYVLEYHKCYKMKYQHLDWYDGRASCNNISSSHPISIEDDVENVIAVQYVNSTTMDYQKCPGSYWSNWFTYYTSGFQTYAGGVKTPFYWVPYPGISKLVRVNGWHVGEPSAPNNGVNNCLVTIITGYIGWDDQECSTPYCVLCEYDLVT
ncbi:hypothetical protein HELRODRAFT_179329 [Helobdella robusta]|uniref:C-type lectin domain-containing protein n=1 Tax=Helobdella robusta TaxID=6412 RepID=T1FEK2_HELRO|nr:hypothetical protein HELRODRAFT_179329 [Helobdella robusta]ESN95553.1 hypothetical protein HELRODRAFT_179329 [Helobdella robusta]